MLFTQGWRATVAVMAVALLVGCDSPSAPPGATQERETSVPSPSGSPTPHPFAGSTTWIAYQTDRGGQEGVWLTHPDGSANHQIARDLPGEQLHPDWSPDGSQLVVTSRADRDVLYVVDGDTDAGHDLWDCVASCVGDDEAVWSPDGSQIAFVRAMKPITNGVPSCALFVGDVQRGKVDQLGTTVSCLDRETFPHWSSDGSRIAYYRGVYEGDRVLSTALYVLEVSTREETKLTKDTMMAGDSDWAADDEWLVFTTFPLNDFQCCERSNLYRIHPDGSGLEQLTKYKAADLRATQPRYTPDGESIIFTAVGATSRLPWVIPSDGGEPIAVATAGIYTHNTWQPDQD